LTYLVYRWTLAFFFAFSVGFSISTNIERGHFHVYFIYWTHLNIFATMIMALLGAVFVTLHHFGSTKNKDTTMSLSTKVYWALWNQSYVFACLISGSYWILLHNGEQIDLNNVLVHFTNVAVLFIDLLIVKHPPTYRNFYCVTFVGICYGVFTMIYQFCGGVDK
jgi:hypothetical protein